MARQPWRASSSKPASNLGTSRGLRSCRGVCALRCEASPWRAVLPELRCRADGRGPREERKLVSILFVDQVGSTPRADGADPEDVRDRNRIYYEETRARIERYGGTLEKYAGDAVMAVFGLP